MRIALVQPPPRSEYDRHWARFQPRDRVHRRSLRAVGHTIDLLDGKLADLSVDDIVAGVRNGRPDLVGITCMTVEYPRAVEIARSADQARSRGGAGRRRRRARERRRPRALEEGEGFDYVRRRG